MFFLITLDVLEEPTVVLDEFSGWPPKPETWFTWAFKLTGAGITQLRSLLYATRLFLFTRDTIVLAALGIGMFTFIWKLDPALGSFRPQLDGWLLKKKADSHSVVGTRDGHAVPQTRPPESSRYWYPTWGHTAPQETSPARGAYRTPPPPDYGPVRTSVPSSKPTATTPTHSNVLGNAFLAQYLLVDMLPDAKVTLMLSFAVVLLLLVWFSEPRTSDQLTHMEEVPNVINPASHQSDETSEADEWRAGTTKIAEREGDWESETKEGSPPEEGTPPEKDTPKLESKEVIQDSSLSLDSGRYLSSSELNLQNHPKLTNQNDSASITEETSRFESDEGSVFKTSGKISVAPSPSTEEGNSVEMLGHPPASTNPKGASETGNEALTSEIIGFEYVATDTPMSTPVEANLEPSQTIEGQHLTAGENSIAKISSASSTESTLDESMLRKISAVETEEKKVNNISATDESPSKENRNEHHEPTPGGVTISSQTDQYKDNIELAIRQPVSSPPMIEDHQSGMEIPVLLEDAPLKRRDEESAAPKFLPPNGQIERSEALEYSPTSSWNTASEMPSIPMGKMGLRTFGGGGVLAPGDRAVTSEFVDHFISRHDENEFVNTSTGVMYNPSPTTMFVGEDTDEARFLGELYVYKALNPVVGYMFLFLTILLQVSQHLSSLLGPDIYQPEENWTSSARSRNGHKPFDVKEPAYSTFTIVEKPGIGKARDSVSRAFKLSDPGHETCRFHIQVCVTAGGLQSPFRLSNAQYTKVKPPHPVGIRRYTNSETNGKV